MKPTLMPSFSQWLLLLLALAAIILSRSDAVTITLPLSSPCVEDLQKAKEPGSNPMDVMRLGVCLHTSWNTTMAYDVYQYLLETAPGYAYVHVNLGALFSIAGKPQLAIEQYELYFEKVGGIYGNQTAVDAFARQNGPACRRSSSEKRDCVNALNNLASAHLTEGKNSSAVSMYLERAIAIGDDDMLTKVYANLGGLMSKIGNEDGAADAFIKSFWLCLKQNDVEFATGLLVRRALLIPTISTSIAQTELDRIAFQQRIRDVTELARVGGSTWKDDKGDLFRLQSGASNPDDIRQIPALAGKLTRWSDAVQTPHFFVHYKGYYDLPIQQQVFAMFTELCPPNLFEVAPHLLNPNTYTKLPSPKKKVGFISSLIGDDEPHGLLVLDVIRSLSKTSYFEFFIISNGPKAPSEVFYNVTSGNVFTMGFDDNVTRDLLKSLELDCLVYLEAMNDAIMYFLGYQRFANVQILAMGSPVTSGVETFDYFVSGDLLEHPFRTQMRSDHYSEQVVLFDGQAISFPSSQFHPRQDAALAAGDAHSLSKMSPLDELKMLRRRNGHVYLCFQSIFKIQPLFDHVLADILVADYQGHIVLQASRHANQTSVVAARLQTVLKEKFCGTSSFECPAMTDAYSRVHFIGRVTSDKLIDVLQQASVILHPFPFGGSKTSLDAINAAIPIVAYPQKYLRGRLEVFLRFLDLNEIDPDAGSCCMASSVSDYVAKAVRLASDESYRTRVSNAFRERRTRIFDDKFIALEWGKLLTRALGINASEEALLSQISFSRKSYQQDDYFAKKIEEEQMRWSQNAVLSAVTSPH